MNDFSNNMSILRELVNKYPLYPERNRIVLMLDSYENNNDEDMINEEEEIAEYIKRYKVYKFINYYIIGLCKWI